MSQSKLRIPSPARSQGPHVTPRRKTRRTLSVASLAKSDTSGKLTSIVEQFLKDDKFTVSPMTRRSVLPDDTDIEVPRRASWWKRVEGSSRDVLEALDTNQMQGDMPLEEYEFEVHKEKQTIQTLPESSDNDSVASVVVPQRRLFNQKKQPQKKFSEIMVSRKSLGMTNLEDQDQTIKGVPKNLFNQGQPRKRPVFPAALLDSTNKTVNKTVEPVPNKQGRNLFGQAGTKRKNMFTDFVLSESEEEDSLVQHKVFGFKKKDNKRISLASRNRRMPSLTPSVTTEIDIDDWNLLPSSTMIGNGSGALEVSRNVSDNEIDQAQNEDQDVTLTEANESLIPEADTLNTSKNKKNQSLNRTRLGKSTKQNYDFDKTLTNENITTEKSCENNAKLKKANKSHRHNKTVLSESHLNKTVDTEKSKHESAIADAKISLKRDEGNGDINDQRTENEPSIENRMAELHGESGEKDKSEQEIEPSVEQDSGKEISNDNHDTNMKEQNNSEDVSSEHQDEEMGQMVWSDVDTEKASAQDESEENDKNDAQSEEENSENDDDHEEVDKSDGEDENEASDCVTPVKEIQDENQKMADSSAEKEEQEEMKQENDEKEELDHVTPVKENPHKTQKIVDSSAEVEEQDQMEQENDVVDETLNLSHDTTGRKRKKHETEVKSPETVLQNISKDDMSFKPMGRSTSFRKSKSAIEEIHIRPTLIPIQESTIGSEGSRNSSTDASGWDSHRTTRKTLRQTFGKDFTPRKSLRVLVMEQSAKRQTEVYKNTSKANKTTNKTVLEDAADRHIRDRHVSSNHDLSSDQLPDPKSPVPDISTHHVIDPLISKPQVSYHKSLRNINEPDISDQKISIREKSVNVNQVTDDSGPEISIDASYGQGMSREVSDHENDNALEKTAGGDKSRHKIAEKKDFARMEIDQEMQEELDYDPSVREDSIHDASVAEISKQEKSSEALSDNEESDRHISKQKSSIQELSNHDASQDEEKEDSEQELEAEESEQELEESQQNIEEESEHEMELELSQQEIDVESEQEENEESQQEIEVESDHEEENEKSHQEIEDESEQEEVEESEQEIEVESDLEEDNEGSRQEIEVEFDHEEDNEESQQDIEIASEPDDEHEKSQQEIEVESENEVENEQSDQEDLKESEHELEVDSEQESDNEQSHQQDASKDNESYHQESEQESDHDVSHDSNREVDSDNEQTDQEDSVHILSGLDTRHQTSKRLTQRVVFDNEMSDEEIDYEISEKVSRQITDNEISEQVSDAEDERQLSVSRFSEQADPDESIGTKKSLLRMQLQRIAQQNLETRQRISKEVLDSLKPTNNIAEQPYYVRPIKKPEPKKPKEKPRKPALLLGTLPKEFVEDLKYKPPKRYAPKSAPWITKYLYKFLENKLEPKYDYRARVRAEELVQTIHSFTKMVRRRREVAPQHAIDELKKEMARLKVVRTHHDFYHFFHEFMPREVRLKVNPSVVNEIPCPSNVFEDILQSRAVP